MTFALIRPDTTIIYVPLSENFPPLEKNVSLRIAVEIGVGANGCTDCHYLPPVQAATEFRNAQRSWRFDREKKIDRAHSQALDREVRLLDLGRAVGCACRMVCEVPSQLATLWDQWWPSPCSAEYHHWPVKASLSYSSCSVVAAPNFLSTNIPLVHQYSF